MRILTRLYRDGQKSKLKKQFEEFYNTIINLLQEHKDVIDNQELIQEHYDKIHETIEQL